MSCFNVGAKTRQPSRSFPLTSFCFALPLRKTCLTFAQTLFCFLSCLIFFSVNTEQNRVGIKQRLGYLAFGPMLKPSDNRVTLYLQLHFVSLYRWGKLVSLLLKLYFISYLILSCLFFFSGKAKQNEVGGKERLGCLAFAPTLKRNNRVTLFLQLHFVSLYRWRKLISLFLQLYFVSLYRWRRFVFLLLQPFLCFTFLWQQYLLFFCSKRLKYKQLFLCPSPYYILCILYIL